MGSLKLKKIILRVIYSILIFIFLKIFFKVADSNDLYEKFDILNEKLDKFGDLNEKLQKLESIDEKLKVFQQNTNIFSIIYNFSGFLAFHTSMFLCYLKFKI